MYVAGFLVLLTQFLGIRGLAHSRDDSNGPTVDLGYSEYRGSRIAAGVDQFLGMRFAAPPLADLRFRAPRDPVNTTGIQDATSDPPICVGLAQQISDKKAEDCLFINVFKPSNATAESNLPVWLFIQGGGYTSNAAGNYNGSQVIQVSGHDILFVTFNYRVGAYGFLASETVRQDGDLNVGLLDQRKAFEWVQRYIRQFGGNPNHVVLHGSSAGAGSVAHHLTAYGGRNDSLFTAAAAQSPFWPALPSVADMEFQFDRFVKDASCDGRNDTMSCIRAADVNELQSSANVPSIYPGADHVPLWYFVPVIDDDLVPDYLYRLLEQGKFIKVPLLVGDDTDEGSFFAPNAKKTSDISSFFKANYPSLNSSQLRQINDAYSETSPVAGHNKYFAAASAAYGDSTFTCPGNFMCSSTANYFSPNKTWNYRYNVQDPEWTNQGLGVPHTWDSSAILGPGHAHTLNWASDSTYTAENAPIVPIVMHYWISFVKYLDPNPYRNSNAPVWEPWGSGTGQRLKIQTNDTVMESVPQSLTKKCKMWRELMPSMRDVPSEGGMLNSQPSFLKWMIEMSLVYFFIN